MDVIALSKIRKLQAQMANIDVPAASEGAAGVAELATEAEVLAGTSTDTLVTPATLQAKVDALPAAESGGVTDDDVLEIIFLGGN